MSRADGTRPERRVGERGREERYQQLVELAPDGILIHDGGRIVLANAAAVRLAGATHRSQLVGQPIDRFLDPPYLKAVQSQLMGPDAPVLESAPPVRDTFHRLDGAEVEVEVRTTAFMQDGHPSAHVVVRDISERLATEQRARQFEERLQQAQRIEAVGALAGGVAHEINNMMSVVLGFSSFLLRDPILTEGQRSEVEQISKAAGRAASVTGQLLSFSRRAYHEPRVVDLGAAMRDLEPVVRRLLGEDRQLIMAADTPVLVVVDPRQLEQVIVNLALNARDAMPVGATLTITAEECELTAQLASSDGAAIPAGCYGLITVRDTGAGMDDATRTRIFEPFFTTKPVGQGSGLGLAAAYGIMRQNEGYIAVASGLGEGTVFSIYLPVPSPAETTGRREEPRALSGEASPHAATVLVVEDEPDVRAVVARSLELGGFRVLQAADGAAALDLVGRHGPPDLVLADLVLPGIGGAELARRLRARWPELPIIFTSGYSTEDLRRHDADGLEAITVPKPFAPDGLVASVVAALAHWSRKSGAFHPVVDTNPERQER